MKKLNVLKQIFGYDFFRYGQEEIIDSVCANENVFAIMPTGGGKSLCYQLPALLREGTCLIVSPLIALMRDQVRFLNRVGVKAAALHSLNTDEEMKLISEEARLGSLKMLYIAPERLGSKRFINFIKGLQVSLIVVDEAHCVSQWGHDFRPDYLKINSLNGVLGDVQLVALTATADPETQADIAKYLFTKKPNFFLTGFDRPNIRLNCKLKDKPRKQLLDFIGQQKNQSGIVYCNSRTKTEVLARALNENGYKATFYHAGMTSERRKAVEERFQKDNGLIICATIAFGMGIDKPDIRFVVHADLPKTIENFYQEIGRAGRDGLPSNSLLLYSLDDVRSRQLQIDQSSGGSEKRARDHIRLNSFLGFVESQSCRRRKILEYFERKVYPNCQNCDVCIEAPKLFDATELVKKILSIVLLAKENFDPNYLIDILRGVTSDKILAFSNDQLTTLDSGRDCSKQQWQAIFLQILGLDYIRPSSTGRGSFYVTKKSFDVLSGNQKVILKLVSFNKKSEVYQINQPQSLVFSEDEPLFIALQKKRREVADSMNIPAYIVFSDKTLIQMVDKKPKNLDQMLLIHGVGKKKLFKFGDQFLKVINGDHARKTHPARKKIVGKPNACLFDLIEDVIHKHSRGIHGLDKPLHVSPALIRKIFQRKPKKLSELKSINGMTARILERYGKPLIQAISSST